MRKIEVKILNPEAVSASEKMLVCAARLTQRGHQIKSMADFMALYEKTYEKETVSNMANLPHTTIQKFGVINVVIVGASRRFLTQITRHQNEVKFMSASLQYSNYSNAAEFVVPYSILERGAAAIEDYLYVCQSAMEIYSDYTDAGIDNDTAGYIAPQSLRNILVISATPFQWKHMIGQRICRRNTSETRYVMLLIWERLYELNSILFSANTTGAFCMRGACEEGAMACGSPIKTRWAAQSLPASLLKKDFPYLYRQEFCS
jgi:thymidylate synthase (FAD)